MCAGSCNGSGSNVPESMPPSADRPLVAVKPSAPASTAALATGRMSASLGESFTLGGGAVACFTHFTVRARGVGAPVPPPGLDLKAIDPVGVQLADHLLPDLGAVISSDAHEKRTIRKGVADPVDLLAHEPRGQLAPDVEIDDAPALCAGSNHLASLGPSIGQAGRHGLEDRAAPAGSPRIKNPASTGV